MDSIISKSNKKRNENSICIFGQITLHLYIDNCNFIILTVPIPNQEMSFHLFKPLL